MSGFCTSRPSFWLYSVHRGHHSKLKNQNKKSLPRELYINTRKVRHSTDTGISHSYLRSYLGTRLFLPFSWKRRFIFIWLWSSKTLQDCTRETWTAPHQNWYTQCRWIFRYYFVATTTWTMLVNIVGLFSSKSWLWFFSTCFQCKLTSQGISHNLWKPFLNRVWKGILTYRRASNSPPHSWHLFGGPKGYKLNNLQESAQMPAGWQPPCGLLLINWLVVH